MIDPSIPLYNYAGVSHVHRIFKKEKKIEKSKWFRKRLSRVKLLNDSEYSTNEIDIVADQFL